MGKKTTKKSKPKTTIKIYEPIEKQYANVIEQAVQTAPAEASGALRQNAPTIMRALRKEGILSPNVLAYALATTQHETAQSFEPVREGFYNDQRYGYEPGFTGSSEARKRKYSGGEDYYGRGFIQLTHDYNYKDMGKKIGLGDSLYQNPDKALEPDIAARVMAKWFKDKGIANLVNQGKYEAARLKINPDQKGPEIAKQAQTYQRAIESDPAWGSQGFESDRGNEYIYNGVLPTQPPGLFERIINKVAPPASAAERTLQTQQPTYQPGPRTIAPQLPQSPPQYTVRPNETLWGIAQKQMGQGSRWKELGYQGNPRQMPVGTPLTIPQPKVYQPGPSTPMMPPATKPAVQKPAVKSIQSAVQPVKTQTSAQLKPANKTVKPSGLEQAFQSAWNVLKSWTG